MRYQPHTVYRETVQVDAGSNGKPVWRRDVEIFDLSGHSTAKRAYAWGHIDAYDWADPDESEDGLTWFSAVLEIPPVDSAEKAVRMEIARSAKELREIKKAFKKEMDEKFSKPFPPSN